jgi:hypothetical protein
VFSFLGNTLISSLATGCSRCSAVDVSVCAVSETCFKKPVSRNRRPLRYSGF